MKFHLILHGNCGFVALSVRTLAQLYWMQQTLTQITLSVILHKISSVNAKRMLLTNNGGPAVSAIAQDRSQLLERRKLISGP